MKKMLFVYNPMAGKEQISTHLSNIVQVFCKASFEVTIDSRPERCDSYCRRAWHGI